MKLLDTFVAKVIAVSDYTEDDMFYLRNRVLALVGKDGVQQETKQTELIALKDELVDLAVQNGKVGELVVEKDCLGAELINFITPVPSQVNRKFLVDRLVEKGDEKIVVVDSLVTGHRAAVHSDATFY